MDLDSHAERAATDLRRQVEPNLDVRASRAALDTARRRHRAHLVRVRGGVIALAAVAVLAVLVASAGPGTGDGVVTNEVGMSLPGRAPADLSARGAAILNALPRGPIDGRESWRLPIVVEPQNGLQPGQLVTIYGRGFEPDQSLGIVQCTSEADTGAQGVGACQLAADGQTTGFGNVTYATAAGDGTVVAKVAVRRYVETPNGGKVDCLEAAERCLIGVGAVSNYDQSGGAYIGFADAPPFPDPVFSIDPGGPYVAGQTVHARGSAFAPGRAVRIQQCRGKRCQKLADGKSSLEGAVDIEVVLQDRVVDPVTGTAVDCEGQCVLQAVGIGVKGASSAPMPDPVPIDVSAAAVTSTTTATVPETTTSIVSDTEPGTTQPATTAPESATTTSVAAAPPDSSTATTEPVTTTAVGSSPP